MVKKPEKVKTEKAEVAPKENEVAPKEKIAEPQKLETSRIKVDPGKTERSGSLDEARTQKLSESLNLRLDKLGALVDEARADSQYKTLSGNVMERISDLENKLTANNLRLGGMYTPNQTTTGYSRRCCECLSDRCCSFDIILKSIRLLQAQVEPVDWAEVPGLIIKNEVQFFCWLDNDKMSGILHPPLLGHSMGLRKKFNKPGIWLGIGRTIGTVSVQHGQLKTVGVKVNGIEYDAGIIERPTAMKDEYGVAQGSITLDCCSEKILATNIELDLSQGGGMGGGALEFEFYAKRVCC